MSKEILTFGEVEIEKKKFSAIKLLFFQDANIEKVLVSNKILFGEENCNYLICCLYNDNKVKPLHLMLPKTIAYAKSYDGQTQWMYFLIRDDLLEKYNTIWDKISANRYIKK